MAGAASLFACAVLGALLALTTLLPGPAYKYYLLLPGDAFPIATAVKVPDERRRDTGQLSFTVVYQQQAGFLDAVMAAGRRGVRVVPYEAIIPRGTTPEESTQANRRLMSESQTAAAVVALRALGHTVEATGRGVRIAGLVADRPAEKVLKKDDVVTAFDGRPVRTATELIEAIRRRKPGDTVELTVRRGDQTLERLKVETVPAPDDPERPVVGAFVETEGFQAELPFPVEIAAGSVIGPSAGMMFALGIYDALTPGPLGDGQTVAGTGTIGLDGRVGAVEGVAQKVIGAEKAGATLFLAPKETYEEARAVAGTIRVVPVATFEEALAAVRGM